MNILKRMSAAVLSLCMVLNIIGVPGTMTAYAGETQQNPLIPDALHYSVGSETAIAKADEKADDDIILSKTAKWIGKAGSSDRDATSPMK